MNKGVEGVRLTNFQDPGVTTIADGTYSTHVDDFWPAFTVTPDFHSYAFDPGSYPYTSGSGDHPDQNFRVSGPTIEVRGYVLDQSTNPISGARVEAVWEGEAEIIAASTVTNSYGEYTLTLVSHAFHPFDGYLRASRTGHIFAPLTDINFSGSLTGINFRAQPAANPPPSCQSLRVWGWLYRGPFQLAVGGARIEVWDDDNNWGDDDLLRVTTTDYTGKFQVDVPLWGDRGSMTNAND